MILICKYCGNEFESKNSNQSFCSKICSAKYQQQTATEAAKKIKDDRIRRYYDFPKRCKCCESVLQYEDRSKTFCNSSCAATYNNLKRTRQPWNDEQKKNMSEIMIIKHQDHHNDNFSNTTVTPRKIICKWCGREFISKQLPSGKYSSSKFCSDECKKLNNIEVGKRAIIINKEKGTWKPWQSRNISSYPEKFFEKVLNNNHISYIREKYIGGYFLDFYIEKNNRIIDLEIDGDQHEETQEKDRIRDEYLKGQNIEVYRIKWNSINSSKGKENMKIKIDDFLIFYNS
jgi:very-short-patch-repair endonuclease